MMQGLSEEYYRNYLEHILECDDCWKIYLSSLHIINKHLEQRNKRKGRSIMTKYMEFTIDELDLLRNGLSNGFPFPEPAETLSKKLQKEISEEIEFRNGIVHTTK